jgi:hypothetical protein
MRESGIGVANGLSLLSIVNFNGGSAGNIGIK